MIKVQKDDFDINKEIKKITSLNKNIGGTGLFIGNVRERKKFRIKINDIRALSNNDRETA